MMALVRFSVARPKVVFALALALSVIAGAQFRRITTDTNPKSMLPANSDVRRNNAEVERIFGLYDDAIVVGVQNDRGVLNLASLGRIFRLTEQIQRIEGVAEQDVTSLSTVTNVSAEGDTLRVGPLMAGAPASDTDVASLRRALDENPLFRGRLISLDLTTTAIYAPLTRAANGKVVADQIRALLPGAIDAERYYIAGDPVVRDTFGAEMFRAMAVFAPMAGLVMMALAF